jgi:hypothetical protein
MSAVSDSAARTELDHFSARECKYVPNFARMVCETPSSFGLSKGDYHLLNRSDCAKGATYSGAEPGYIEIRRAPLGDITTLVADCEKYRPDGLRRFRGRYPGFARQLQVAPVARQPRPEPLDYWKGER